ncbi:hypothetical protein FA15DRAFT_81326 [Coprinopsis marcescibilis]|uniref:Uncharacterized protein n=1 Tax=Coprinopsis marcescibilis TaxID=230819 RepID=A0A5C3KMZ4_COPMA|nr:hypothetical protein FA15DRAFT_81326 [Coprinopsis marcescibilis]
MYTLRIAWTIVLVLSSAILVTLTHITLRSESRPRGRGFLILAPRCVSEWLPADQSRVCEVRSVSEWPRS